MLGPLGFVSSTSVQLSRYSPALLLHLQGDVVMFFPLLNTMSTNAETHWPACNEVGLQNLEARSPLCLRPHSLFILFCSEFRDSRSCQLCLTAGHGKGSFHNPLELLQACWPPVHVPVCISDIPFPSELFSQVWYCQHYCSRLQHTIMQKLLLQLSSVWCTLFMLVIF